jgi:hypothetical protein
MNIVFYAGHKYYGGLGLCGGARTTLMSAQVLRDMGHKVSVVAPSDKFTWFDHPKVLSEIPKDTEAVIACSVSDIKGMHKTAPKNAKKFYWMRGLEKWQIPEEQILKEMKRGHRNIVNSSWLKRVVNGWGIDCDLVWQGVDIDLWLNKADIDYEAIPSIGCLYNTKHNTKRWDMFVSLIGLLGEGCSYNGFGVDKPKQNLKMYLQNPKQQELRRLYNSTNIWFCPTELDSFHNVPLEAALCGCLVMCRRIESNGMEDYATDETAMRFDSISEAISLIKKPDYSKVKKMQDLIVNKIGDRKRSMQKLMEVLNG